MRKNKFWTRRIPAFAIAAAMVLTMMPQTSLTALAKGQGDTCEQDECTETISALSEGKEATCKDFGEKKYASCGNSSTPHYYDEEGELIDLTEYENSINNWAKIEKSTTHGIITKQNGQPATCDADGWKDYYQCETCNAYFEDEEGKTPIENLEEWKENENGGLIKKGHVLEKVSEQAGDCKTPHIPEYYKCTADDCNKIFSDKAAENEITDVTGLTGYKATVDTTHKAGAAVSKYPAVTATCTTEGHKALYLCDNTYGCGIYYTVEGDVVTNLSLANDEAAAEWYYNGDGKIPAAHKLSFVAYSAATCDEDGIYAHFVCSECDKEYPIKNADDDAKKATVVGTYEADTTAEASDAYLKEEKGHKLVLVPYEAATCSAAGNVAYFTCSNDGDDALYAVALTDAGKTAFAGEDVDLTKITATKYDEHKDYYTVGTEYADEDAVVLEKEAHSWDATKHEDAVAETCTTDGSYEYGFCSECETYYAVKAGNDDSIVVDTDVNKSTNEVAQVADTFKIAAIGHANAVDFAEVAATCKETGCKAYWYCPDCKKFSLTDPTASPTVPLTDANLTSYYILPVDDSLHSCAGDADTEPKAATCGTAGTRGIWTCDTCGIELTKNADGGFIKYENDNDVIVADGTSHGDSAEKVEATTPDCATTALAAYWYCEDCEKYYVDDNDARGDEITDFDTWKTTAVDNGAPTVGGLIAKDPAVHKEDCLKKCNGDKDATCEEAGIVESWYCSACEKYYSDEDGLVSIGDTDAYNTWLETDSTDTSTFTQGGGKIAATGHVWTSVAAVAGNCVTPGTKAHFKCNTCEKLAIEDEDNNKVIVEEADLEDDSSVAQDGHDIDSFVAYEAATCETGGHKAYVHCRVCDKYYGLTDETATADDGDYLAVSEDATTAFDIAPDGHKAVPHAAVEATCSIEGYRKYYTCENCEKVSSNGTTFVEGTKAMFSLGKNSDNHKNIEEEVGKVEATCGTFGFSGNKQCADCGKITEDGETLAKDETAHVYVPVDGKEAKDATCTEDGYTGDFKCEYCDDVIEGDTIEATGHQHTKTVGAKAATCGADGYTGDVICLDCAEVAEEGEVIPATGEHSYDEGTVTTEATYTTEGVKTYTCTDCGATKTESIAKLVCEHKNVKVYDKKDATCTAEGYTGDTVCKDCGTFTEGTVIAKTAHSYKDGKCSVCGAADPDYKEPEPEIPNDYFAENNNMYFYKAADGKVTCLDSEGNNIINGFVSDGKYTYYFQADGTAMQDRLTYHPDGEHVIYFDEEGHEVFNTFHHIKRSIAGEEVDDLCFFDMNGYMYVNVMTYDQAGENIYYVNPNGVIERGNWFKFSDTCVWAGTDKKVGTGYGYANADGTLMINTYTYNWNNDLVYMQGDGHMK